MSNKKLIKLKGWSVVGDAGPVRLGRLSGEAYGHPRFDYGTPIVSTPIKDAQGRYITTVSGSLYYLEDACEEYLSWLVEIEYENFDPENPIRLRAMDRSN